MATVYIPEQQRAIFDADTVAEHLASVGIEYERWAGETAIADDAGSAEILEAFASDIERLKTRGGYVAADVVAVSPSTPGLEEMLVRFAAEHTHDEDEVRLVVGGRGICHVHPSVGPVTSIEVEAGDLIRVPAGTRHWFGLCADRTIKAIRLFRDPAGWVPRYTSSGLESAYEPICFGAPMLVTAAREEHG